MKRYQRGGALNTTLPDLSKYEEFLPEGFHSWLAAEVGYYRLFSQNGRETKRDNTTALTEFVENLEAVIKLSPELLPPSADMLLDEVLYQAHGTSCGEELRQLKNHATRMRAEVARQIRTVEISGRCGHEAGPRKVWQGVQSEQEEVIGTAHAPPVQF